MSKINYLDMVTDNLLAYPITRMIDRSLEADGLNPNHGERKVFAGVSSTGLGLAASALGLGGPAGIILGLLGYCIGMAVKCDEQAEPEDHRWRLLEPIKEQVTDSLRRLRDALPYDVNQRLGDKFIDEFDYYSSNVSTSRELIESVYSFIYDFDPRAANLWIHYLHEEME